MGVNLVGTTALVQTPYIKVTIGNYTFGNFDAAKAGTEKFPNYVQGLEVEKINGQVNKYELRLEYMVTEYNDPNFFEKVFASVSQSRKIVFTYGDLSMLNYMYKEEEAMITKVQTSFDIDGSKLTYTVSAVSVGTLGYSGSYPFNYGQGGELLKPSDIIFKILKDNETFGLLDLFTGMKNMNDQQLRELIPVNDTEVSLQPQLNVSPLTYLQYLVDNMTRNPKNATIKNSFYVLRYMDDTSGKYNGPYFEIKEIDASVQHPEAYELYIGYPNINAVTNFRVEQSENYSIFYEYQQSLHKNDYVKRIDAYGREIDVYAPVISSNNSLCETREIDKTWWTKMTQYPIKASLEIRGLLRPAVLMSYVRLKVLMFNKLHVNSGLYVITKQVDEISEQGYKTTLNLTRIAGDEEIGVGKTSYRKDEVSIN